MANSVHLLPVCFITSDWPITAAVRETMPKRPLQFWTAIWLKYINLARADVVCRRTERDVKTVFPSPLLFDEKQVRWQKTFKNSLTTGDSVVTQGTSNRSVSNGRWKLRQVSGMRSQVGHVKLHRMWILHPRGLTVVKYTIYSTINSAEHQLWITCPAGYASVEKRQTKAGWTVNT